MEKGYRLSAATGLHRGDRQYQQDQVMLLAHPRVSGCVLGVVADGMGGRTGGRKAADQVMLTARQLFERFSPDSDDATGLLMQIAREAHLVIKLTAIAAEQEPHSTVAAFVVNPGGECHWLHAGDSRVYHFRGLSLVRRTKDHSYVQMLVDQGQLTEEEATVHPRSNVLMGCLGTEDDPRLDTHFVSQLQIGDTLMACTDGVWHYFTTEELGAVLHALPPREASEFLIEKARTRAMGGGDNLSLVIVQVEALPEEKATPASSAHAPLR
jgi:serine/threonine protein phosphatase PrpC